MSATPVRLKKKLQDSGDNQQGAEDDIEGGQVPPRRRFFAYRDHRESSVIPPGLAGWSMNSPST
jgi:NADH:ubiquinone oxidoreductase subunit